MSRVLSKNVVVGGCIYPAGSTVDDDTAEKITADVWAEPAEELEQAGNEEPEGEAAPRSRRTRKSED